MRTIVIAGLLAVSGCAGVGYAIENYSGVEKQKFASTDGIYVIMDKPQEGRLMIMPTVAESFAAGAAQGATLGIADDPTNSIPRFQNAAADYLSSTGKNCDITSGAKVIHPQYEFFYTCPK